MAIPGADACARHGKAKGSFSGPAIDASCIDGLAKARTGPTCIPGPSHVPRCLDWRRHSNLARGPRRWASRDLRAKLGCHARLMPWRVDRLGTGELGRRRFSMRGVVFLGDRRLELRDFPDPTPGPRE